MDISALRLALQESGESPQETRGTIEAQRVELTNIIASYHTEPEVFRHGDLIEFKHGLGSFRPELRGTHAFAFWSYFDANNASHQHMYEVLMKSIGFIRADCIIVYLENGLLMYQPADSHTLRRVS